MKRIKRILPHICLIFSGTFVTFFILDKFNTEMAFINNNGSKLLLLLFCIVSIVVSLMLIFQMEKEG